MQHGECPPHPAFGHLLPPRSRGWRRLSTEESTHSALCTLHSAFFLPYRVARLRPITGVIVIVSLSAEPHVFVTRTQNCPTAVTFGVM